MTAVSHRIAGFSVELDEAATLAEDLHAGSTLPLSWYASPEVHDAEAAKIFRTAWHYVGHLGQLSSPGDFVTTELAGVPIIVTRDTDGTLHALHNVCRHRGAEVVLEAAGNKRRLQCHYHAWTYGLDGALRAAPRADREDCFVKENLGLRKASVDTWGPFVFAHLDAAAPPLLDTLGIVPELVAATGVDVDTLRFHSRVEYDVACNWKVAMENFLECYHCPTAHPGFSDVLDTRLEAYDLVIEPTFAWQNGPLRPQPPAVPPRETGYTGRDGEVPEGRYFAIWPSLKININPGLQNVSIGPMTPTSPGSCHGLLDYFFGADVTEEWIADMFDFDNEVGDEDRVLIESVQKGVRSGSLDTGRIMLSSEKLISGFQNYVLDTLTSNAAQ